MSRVTDVLITASLADADKGIALQEWFDDHRDGERAPQLYPSGLAGGSKHMQAVLFVGAHNYLGDEEIADLVRSVRWKYRESVRVFVQGEHDDYFQPFTIEWSDRGKLP